MLPAIGWIPNKTTYLGDAQLNDDDNALYLFLLLLLSFLLPPVAVGLRGGLTVHLLLSCILTFFLYVPGVVHALWYVLLGGNRD